MPSSLSLLYTNYKYQLYILMNRSRGRAIKNFYQESIINFLRSVYVFVRISNYFEILFYTVYLYIFFIGME